MIIIVNQHRGSDDELIQHIHNYLDKLKCNKFYMILVYDDPRVPSESITRLINLVKSTYSSKLKIINSYGNRGLSECRSIALDYARNNFDSIESIIFGCTNSRWTLDLDERLYNLLTSESHPVTLINNTCENDLFDRKWDWGKSEVKFDEYFNNEYRPDFTLMFKYTDQLEFDYIQGEKYYPEESIILDHLSRSNDMYLGIITMSVLDYWYNPNGLSRTFNREFMISNRLGFFTRSEKILTLYKSDEMTLTGTRLKNLIYDYITLGVNINFKFFKGTILEPIAAWAVTKWLSDQNHDNTITFTEHGIH